MTETVSGRTGAKAGSKGLKIERVFSTEGRPTVESDPNTVWESTSGRPTLSATRSTFTSARSTSGTAGQSTSTSRPEPRATSSAWPARPKPVTSVIAWTSSSAASAGPTRLSWVVIETISA